MVLIRALSILCALAALAGSVGCGQSLFDANGDRDGGGGDDGGDDGGPPVPKTCPDTCIADAAADFNQPSSRWRYLEEGPSHNWVPMQQSGNEWFGLSSADNKVRRCADEPGAPACRELPNALLVTTAGNASTLFPALELQPMSAPQVLHIIIRAHVPSDSDEQNIRLYRNGREDVLFTAPGVKGRTVEHEVIVDALADDKFLVTVEPTSSAGPDGGSAALQVFVSQQGESFPSTCQLAASFTEADAKFAFRDLCTNRELTSRAALGMATPPTIVDGPFPELGKAVNLTAGRYLTGPLDSPLTRLDNPVTVQLWVYVESITAGVSVVLFDDVDHDLGGGLDMTLLQTARLQVSSYIGAPPQMMNSTSVPFPAGDWRFVRVVEVNGKISVCINGERMESFEVSPARPATERPVHLGAAVGGGNANFDGIIDDVRVFSTALPCE